jgi:hypothetical protein
MFGRTTRTLRTPVITLVLALAGASVALAGGFALLVEVPAPASDPRLKGAVLVVRPVGCHGPGATVSATAEGLVNGRRRSIPLTLTTVASQTKAPGLTFETFAIKRQWPSEGAWVLAIRATSPGWVYQDRTLTATTDLLVELGPDGSIQTAPVSGASSKRAVLVQRVSGKQRNAIEAALKTLASKAGGGVQAAR